MVSEGLRGIAYLQNEFVQHSKTTTQQDQERKAFVFSDKGSSGPHTQLQFPSCSGPPTLGPAPCPPVPLRPGRAHARSPLRHFAGCRDWAGLSGARGTVTPSDRSPRFLFRPLTSNEERAGRKGRGCGAAGTARRARGRGRRGHVTAALASDRGGGSLPGSPSPPAPAAARKQLPSGKQQLRAHPNQLAPGSRTCDLLLPSSSPLPPAQPGPACEAVSSSVRARRKNSEGADLAPGPW